MTGRGGTRAAVAAFVATGLVACSGSGPNDAATTVPTTAASERAVPECAVSDLLVPQCGAWFGVSSPSADGRFDYRRGLREYRTLVDTAPDILHFYQRGPDPFPTDDHAAMAAPSDGPRSILYFSWKPSVDHTWREVADGAADAAIESVAAGVRSSPHRMFLTIFHEPEDDVDPSESSGMTAADYVAMYRHVVAELRSHDVDNVVYVMGYMGFRRWAPLVDDLYPGDDVVDWIAYDPYGFSEHDTLAMMLNSAGSDGWSGFYDWATAKAPGTPIMLAEWGFDLATNDRADDLVATAPTVLSDEFPMIKALVYWNDLGSRIDSRLTGDAQHAAAFADAFATVAADPYFNRTDTADSP